MSEDKPRKASPYPFDEFTMDVKKEDIEKDIEDMKRLDEWIENSLKVSDKALDRRMTI